MRRRRDGKKKVARVTASVSVNEVDHPRLYSAIVNGDVQIGYFPSVSSFLAAAGERELNRLDTEQITGIQLKEMLKELSDKVDEIKRLSIRINDDDAQDDGFDELRGLFEVSS